jgi:hypothetical protein
MDYLFHGQPLAQGEVLRAKVRDRVAGIPEEGLLDSPVEAAAADVLADVVPSDLVIKWEDMYSPGARETTILVRDFFGDEPSVHVPGTELELRIPFSGDSGLFRVSPTSYTTTKPQAHVDERAGELVVRLQDRELRPEQVQAEANRLRAEIDTYVGWVNADLKKQRDEVQQYARSEIAARRQRLLSARGLESSLPFPIRPAGSRSTYSVPMRRRTLRLTETPRREPFRPEAALDSAIYEEIVETICNFGQTLERSPHTFAKLDEEELRDHLLLVLNANYAGEAAGEVFNGVGKTDILVRHDGKNVFIAECKFWAGAKAFQQAIDQLLGYLVWRDSKAAIILFIRQKGVSTILDKAINALRGHPSCVSADIPADPSLRCDFLLRSHQDETRTIKTALITIVVPLGESL